jgi:peptide/nickel transport system ATP-binding protein
MSLTSMQDDNLVWTEDLKIRFGDTIVVDHINFCIREGEILGIVGESGSGKSMTALSLMGLCPPGAIVSAENGILFTNHKKNKVDLSEITQKQFETIRGNQISMIFQEPMTSLNAVQKCGKQVAEVLQIHTSFSNKEIKRRVVELFHEVLLPDPERTYNKFPHQLSGGQRQRVMIAMALACNPQLLIADEPTTALDVTVQKTILSLLKNLQQKYGMSILFITHDLGVVAEICDRIIVMHQGRIVEELTIGMLRSNQVTNPYTKGLLACKPPEGSKPHRLKTIGDFISGNESSIPETMNPQKDTDNSILMDVSSLSKHFPIGKNFAGKVTAWYKAVDDISFSIFRNETLGLVGESGCGKTTLSRTLLRLTDSTTGSVLFDGHNINDLTRKKLIGFRTQVQIIFQDPYSSLNPDMTIGNALMEPLKVHKIYNSFKERQDYIVSVLEKTGLSGSDLKKYPHQFSGGQRQRVVIARALILKPKLIICDEAVSALDVSIQAQVLNLLNDLKDEFGLTYLFISHDLSIVRYMSDRIMVMKKGKIVETGPSDKLFSNPGNTYTQSLIESIPGRKIST